METCSPGPVNDLHPTQAVCESRRALSVYGPVEKGVSLLPEMWQPHRTAPWPAGEHHQACLGMGSWLGDFSPASNKSLADWVFPMPMLGVVVWRWLCNKKWNKHLWENFTKQLFPWLLRLPLVPLPWVVCPQENSWLQLECPTVPWLGLLCCCISIPWMVLSWCKEVLGTCVWTFMSSLST